MNTKVVSITEVREVEISALPPGEYRGTWGGYEASVEIEGVQYHLVTRDGIRTPSAPCIVTIRDGSVTIRTT